MKNKSPINIHWFRRDLRLDDNAALYHALKSKLPVLTVFIFDKAILDHLENRLDQRVIFIHQQLELLNQELQKYGSNILVKYGDVTECWKEIIQEFNVQTVFVNHDYEPYAKVRDAKIAEELFSKGIAFKTFKDQVIFEKDEVTKDDGNPYTIFTPYSKKWMAKLNDFYLSSYPNNKYFSNFFQTKFVKIISLVEMNFEDVAIEFPSIKFSDEILKQYADRRNIPSIRGTTRISIHLRFGTVSIRELARHSKEISFKWLNELIWRDFYMCILWQFPHVVSGAFKPAYNKIKWNNNEQEFKIWCKGETGYPIVDAGMRELNATGFMHNRVRMITASFLVKHLLIDWRWGEAYFASKLLDFELSSNNGGWQWAASSGCDAAPYFRIFNPTEQTKKFDPDFKYIKKWVPEFQEFNYPQPIVDHKFARERALSTYSNAVGKLKELE